MKNKIIYVLVSCFILVMSFSACKKSEYIIGGTVGPNTSNLTTYDYLVSNRSHSFDTLILLIDKAGMKDAINKTGITFFAFTDNSINNYLRAKTAEVQRLDPFLQYNIDSLIKYDLDEFKDSLNVYIIPSIVDYNHLTEDGTLFETAKSGTWAAVSFETTTDPNYGYSPYVSTAPKLEWFTFIKDKNDLPPPPFIASELEDSVGVHTLCQTSGLHTSTGNLNVLQNSHTMYFRTQ